MDDERRIFCHLLRVFKEEPYARSTVFFFLFSSVSGSSVLDGSFRLLNPAASSNPTLIGWQLALPERLGGAVVAAGVHAQWSVHVGFLSTDDPTSSSIGDRRVLASSTKCLQQGLLPE